MIEHLFDSSCSFELCHLISDSLGMFSRQMPRRLSPRINRRVNVQVMIDEIRIYPWGFVSIPCEHINIFPKKFNQLLPLQYR